MEIEIYFYPVGNYYGATLKTIKGETRVFLNGLDPLDAIAKVLQSCFSQAPLRRAA